MQKNNLQDIFLTKVRKQSLPVTVFLMNGFQMLVPFGETHGIREKLLRTR